MNVGSQVDIISQKNKYQYVPQKFIEVAESLEGQFINHMLKQMEITTGAEPGSTADAYYKDLQLSERSKIMAKKSEAGGLKDMILNQIYPEQYRNEQTYNAIMASQKNKIKNYQNQIKMKE